MGDVPQGAIGARMAGGSASGSEVPGGAAKTLGPQAPRARGLPICSCLGPPTIRHRPSIRERWMVRPSLHAHELSMRSSCSMTC
jgi:hypothetical protein